MTSTALGTHVPQRISVSCPGCGRPAVAELGLSRCGIEHVGELTARSRRRHHLCDFMELDRALRREVFKHSRVEVFFIARR